MVELDFSVDYSVVLIGSDASNGIDLLHCLFMTII
jgi:hypothetical protein